MVNLLLIIQSQEELDSEKIVIEVYDSQNSKREQFLGIYECDFHFIYKCKDHSLHNFWIALANPESDDMTKVRGFLKVSISILHQKDGRVELKTKSTDDPNNMCIMPPQIKLEYKQLKIYISSAKEIPDMDSIFGQRKKNQAECDGYVKCEYMGTKIQTKVVPMKNKLIVWNQVINLAVVYPVISQKILLSVWDRDEIQYKGDDIVGCFEINVKDVMLNKYSDFTFINLYGPPMESSGVFRDKMINNPEIGSCWRGGIMIKIDWCDTDTPQKSVKDIDDQVILKRAADLVFKNDWRFDINYYDLYYLPKEDKMYGLKLQCGGKETIVVPKVL